VKIPGIIRDELEGVLQTYGNTADEFMAPMVADFEKRGCWPWVVIFFREELPVAGHVAALRGVLERVPMYSYSVRQRSGTADEQSVPPLGALTVARKGILRELAQRSRLFVPAWRALSECAEKKSWVCVSDSPPANWLARASEGDGRRYTRAVAAECRRTTPEGYEKMSTVSAFGETVLASLKEDAFESQLWAQRLVERFPKRPRAHLMLARAHEFAGDTQLAISAYHEVIEHARWDAKKLVDDWQARMEGMENRDRLEWDVYRIKRDMVSRETRWAVSEAWRSIGEMHLNRGDLQAAYAACRWGMEEDRNNGRLHMLLGEIHEREGDRESAIVTVATAARLMHGDGYPFYRLGELLRTNGLSREAWRCFEEAARLSPEVPLPWRMLGFMAVVRGFHRKATDFYRKAIEIDPDHAGSWNDMGYAYACMGQGEAAIDAARQAVKLERTQHTWETLGKAYAVAGRPGLAIKCFLRSISLDWYHGEAWYSLGKEYLSTGRREKAVEVLEQLKRIDIAWAGSLSTVIEGEGA
jgi:tetratricopeptide (TPR) repeat protein